MSEKIYAALSEEFIRRMRNWARAVSGQSFALRSSWSIEAAMSNPGLDGTPPPILEGEARDTDEALHTLPARERWAVEEFWLREGRSLREHARGRAIDYHTFAVWTMRGHELLQAEIRRRIALWCRVAAARAAAASTD